MVGVGELKIKLGVEGKVVGVGLKSANGKSRGTAGEGFGSVGADWAKVDAWVCGVVGPVEEEACAGVVNGLGDGIGVVPLRAGAAVSLELLPCCSLKRRRAAFEVASRVLVGSRGGSAVVESVDSDSVRESELVSEAEEVESNVVLAVDCCGASAEAFHSAG